MKILSDHPWLDAMKPITDRLDLCARLDLEFTQRPGGCRALSSLIKEMASIIDNEIKRREAA